MGCRCRTTWWRDLVQGNRVLKLDDTRGNAKAWRGVDVLSFNTVHWWSHQRSLQGWDYMEANGTLYQDMNRLVAKERLKRAKNVGQMGRCKH